MPTNAPAVTDRRRPDEDPVFGHVLVGIDETPESLVAAVQAGALRAPDGRLVLIAVVERYLATHAGLAAADAEDRLLAGTSGDLARARELVDADDAILTRGASSSGWPPSARRAGRRWSRWGCDLTVASRRSRSEAMTSRRCTTCGARC
jgi:hypothetical protein